MPQKLSDAIVKRLPPPEKGNRIEYDSDVKGFGCRVTAAGTRAFVLKYRTRSGRERRITIGRFPVWGTVAARNEAKELKMKVDRGGDPLGDFLSARDAPTVRDLAEEFQDVHFPKLRPSTKRDYGKYISKDILPSFGSRKVADIEHSDIDALHRKITKRGARYSANRTVAVLSKMFALAIKRKWRSDNPAQGIERNQEERRHRYLSPEELANLSIALAEIKDAQAANIIRLLLLTGARRGEVLAAKWDQFDLADGVWTKPGSMTKQKTIHRVPLSAPARQLLSDIRKDAEAASKGGQVSDYVFPGRGSAHRINIKYQWRDVCVAAGIVTMETVKDTRGRERVLVKPSARIHDLRHTYASLLASAGMSLPVIGALLGHSQPATTARYSHLMDNPLREATERVGSLVMPTGQTAEVVPIPTKGSA